ncbi:MAG: 2OG-Fe(II) oxygenase, partial [Nitrospira sp.]|nr:2OG-Fe(II) oxygenase [Nitrospira sp.]
MIKEELDSHTVFVLHDFLSSDECVALIRRSEGLSYETGTVGGFVAEEIRNNERVLVDDKALADTLFNRAAPWLPPVVESRHLVRFNERWRFYRYRPGQTFQPHRDGSYLSLETYEKSEVTFLIYLNDDMAGGETRFFANMQQVAQGCPYLTVKPTRGAALVFLHSIWHEGAVVHSGEKYVLRTDVMYKLLISSLDSDLPPVPWTPGYATAVLTSYSAG